MGGTNVDSSAQIPATTLAALMPMYVVTDAGGCITSTGPTMERVAGTRLIGKSFLDAFVVKRPRRIKTFADLLQACGKTLHLRLAEPSGTQFRAVGGPVETAGGGLMLNMSFGIQVNEAVANHGLTIGDFAATDLTVELLYLMEAKTAAMEESRKLNLKLENARLAAEESSFTDPLTGLRNRRGFEALMPHHIGRNEPFAIMAMDLDFFKEVNDINGHAAGDAVLQEVANRTVSNFRPLDLVTRIGGDEFLIYVSELDRPDVLHRLARRLITRLCEPILFEGLELKLSASIGIATSDGAPSDTLNAIVKRADKALYAAKSAGRGVSRLAPKIEQEEAL